MKITKQIEDKVLELNEEKRSNRFIAKELGIARSSIKKILDRYGKKTHSLHIRLERKGNQLKCLSCGRFKDYETFVYTKTRNAGGTCEECRTKKRRERKNSNLDFFFQYKWRCCKDRSLKYGFICDITKQDLIDLYERQNRKCFYTDVDFAPFSEVRNKQTLSVDKIDPTKGYTRDNIVLCTFRVNTAKGDFTLEEMKKWMPEWAKRIEELKG